jgi:Ca2+-binding EF-hand superfamily protein
MRAILGVLLLLAAAACSSPQPAARPDPRVELAKRNDRSWVHLESTYDGDGDHRITRAEYARGDDSFARLDRDHDGSVTRADFDRELVLPPDLVLPILLVRMAGGSDAKSAELGLLVRGFMRIDTGGDGRVGRAEFDAAAPAGMVGVDRFGTLLAGMDADHDELLSRTEIESWLARRDVDGDGQLALRERATAGPAPLEGLIEPALREPAPAFTAVDATDGTKVELSSLVGKKPIALIFGSFT